MGQNEAMQNADNSTVTMTPGERETLAALRANAHGIRPAASSLGVSRDTYERAQLGGQIRRGSAVLIREGLARLADRGAP